MESILQPELLLMMRETGKRIRVRVSGESMGPTLRDEELITIRLSPPENVKRGNIAAYIKDGKLIVHRIIKKKTRGSQTLFCQKGDNLSGWSWIPDKDILGVVETPNGAGLNSSIIIGYCLGWLRVTLYEIIRIFVSAKQTKEAENSGR